MIRIEILELGTGIRGWEYDWDWYHDQDATLLFTMILFKVWFW